MGQLGEFILKYDDEAGAKRARWDAEALDRPA